MAGRSGQRGRLGFEPLEQRHLLSAVVGRYLFYNQSSFDGNDAAINAADDAAIAPDKSAYRPGITWQITRLTDNDTNDQNPMAWGNQVVWQGVGGEDGGTDAEIFHFDGATTTQLTKNTDLDRNPKISALGILWERGNATTQEIIFHDGETETPLSANGVFDGNLTLSDQRAAWENGAADGLEIYAWNNTGPAVNISNNGVIDRLPHAAGNRIVWVNNGVPVSNVKLWDNGATSGAGTSPFAINDPKVSESGVAFESFASSGLGMREVFLFNGTSVVNLSNNQFDDFDPQIWGNRVVWWGGTFDNYHIYYYDGVTTHKISSGIRNQFPQINDDYIVWQGFDGHDYEIFVFDGTSVTQITNNELDDTNPTLSGNHVVWQAGEPFNGDTREIYQAVLGTAGQSTFENISSHSRGINGISIDLNGPGHGAITAADFVFKVGANNAPETWALAPAPAGVVVRAGEGEAGSDRVSITWPAGAIRNQWLQVTLKGNDAAGGFHTNAGLATSEVFYFGSRVGDTGSGTTNAAMTTAQDEIATRNNTGAGASIINAFDHDRSGAVTGGDSITSRNNTGTMVKIHITSPPAPLVAMPFGEKADRMNITAAIHPQPSGSEEAAPRWLVERLGAIDIRARLVPEYLPLLVPAATTSTSRKPAAERNATSSGDPPWRDDTLT